MPKYQFAALTVAALVAGGCGSSKHPSSVNASATTAPSSVGQLAPTSTSPGLAAPVSAPPGSPGVPAVANATDLATKPQIRAGPGPKPAGLIVTDLVVGTGTTATPSNTVSVKYVGVNYDDGKEFDSSWSHGTQPVDFPLSNVIAGFSQGIVGMKIGGRREIVIPPALGYGPQGSPPVGPNETLVFVVDLVAVS